MAGKRELPTGMVERPGRRGYYTDFKIGGRRIQKKLGTNLEAAKSILNELKARAEKADFGLLDNNYSIQELRDSYLKKCEQELRPRTVKRYRQQLDNILGWLDVNKVSQLSVDRILDYREHRLKKACPSTVNHAVTILVIMLNWAEEKKKIGSNPLKGIKLLPHDHPKEGRPLADDEIARLLKHSPAHWRDVWYAFLTTGVREGELSSLLLTNIDWENRELVIPGGTAKNHRERRIPIEDGLLAILKRQEAEAPHRQPGTGSYPRLTALIQKRFTKDHVFATRQNTPLNSNGYIYRSFMRCCKLAGIQTKTYDSSGRLVEHVDLHSTRRTFATNLIVNGADPKSVQEILGHRTLDMTMRVYAKVKGASKRQAVHKLSYGQGATPPEHLLPMTATGG